MSLLIQFQCLMYCFVYGFVSTGIYHIINRVTYNYHIILVILLQIIEGMICSYLFYKGLILINNGVLRIYFFVFMFLGYVFFQKYYSLILLFYLEKCVRIYRRIIQPYIFFFKKIDVIMEKKVKWVKKKWHKRKNSNSKN